MGKNLKTCKICFEVNFQNRPVSFDSKLELPTSLWHCGVLHAQNVGVFVKCIFKLYVPYQLYKNLQVSVRRCSNSNAFSPNMCDVECFALHVARKKRRLKQFVVALLNCNVLWPIINDHTVTWKTSISHKTVKTVHTNKNKIERWMWVINAPYYMTDT